MPQGKIKGLSGLGQWRELVLITIVSGLPRSGTSMMMKMLEAGGMNTVTDGIREADEDNPRGYYELEKVKKTKEDASWLDDAEGKVVKMISMLLRDLPEDRRYKVIFMIRDLDETLASQQKMLERRGKPGGPGDDKMKALFEKHLADTREWLADRECFDVFYCNYNQTLADSAATAAKVADFLDSGMDREKMAEVTDPSLYRQRRQA